MNADRVELAIAILKSLTDEQIKRTIFTCIGEFRKRKFYASPLGWLALHPEMNALGLTYTFECHLKRTEPFDFQGVLMFVHNRDDSTRADFPCSVYNTAAFFGISIAQANQVFFLDTLKLKGRHGVNVIAKRLKELK